MERKSTTKAIKIKTEINEQMKKIKLEVVEIKQTKTKKETVSLS